MSKITLILVGIVSILFISIRYSPEVKSAFPQLVDVADAHTNLDDNPRNGVADTFILDVTIRDFLDSHSDFEGTVTGRVQGLVDVTLGADGKPRFIANNGSGGIASSETFNQWYNDVEDVNLTTTFQLPLSETEPNSGMYIYSDNTFFPIDGQLFGNQGRSHNYHFTLELHTSFTYKGGEVFEFTGDDDVWVYINDKLAVDLGGVHSPISGSVALDSLGLTKGATYPLDMFFAERHTSQSNFKTLTSIDAPTTPFLDLPISYTNFEVAASGNNKGPGKGRVNSWFDHNLPSFTQYATCPDDVPWEYGYHNFQLTTYAGDVITTSPSTACRCDLGSSCYDGHNGIDFSHDYNNPDEAVLAAAAGKVVEYNDNCQDNNSCVGFGNYVLIDHNNCYATLYGHLESIDSEIKSNPEVLSRQNIGIMGSRGNSTGIHLHFGLYKKPNCEDEDWTEKIAIDPYGWMLLSPDPWPSNTTQPLWKYPIKQQEIIGLDGGSISSPSGVYNANIPSNAVEDDITIELLAGPPVVESSTEFRSMGLSFWLRVFEWALNQHAINEPGSALVITDFTKPVSLTIRYSDVESIHLDEQRMAIFRWDEIDSRWIQLVTSVNAQEHVATAQTEVVGTFNLQAPLICPEDSSEPNDNYDSSLRIQPDNSSTIQLFDGVQDEDWFQFYAAQEGLYKLGTESLSTGVKIKIEIIDKDGITILASNPNPTGASSNKLVWMAPEEGKYFIRISQGFGSTHGCDAKYAITLREEGSIFIPLVRR